MVKFHYVEIEDAPDEIASGSEEVISSEKKTENFRKFAKEGNVKFLIQFFAGLISFVIVARLVLAIVGIENSSFNDFSANVSMSIIPLLAAYFGHDQYRKGIERRDRDKPQKS